MSEKNLEQFYVMIQNSEELQKELELAPDKDSFNAIAVRLGYEHGYNFTAEEVEKFVTEKMQDINAELKDEDLDLVAGAKKKKCPFDTRITFCVVVSSCWGSAC